jgi:hypothetical protein
MSPHGEFADDVLGAVPFDDDLPGTGSSQLDDVLGLSRRDLDLTGNGP